MNASSLARSLLRTSLAAVVLAAATAAPAEEIPGGPVASSDFNLAPGAGVLVGPIPSTPVPSSISPPNNFPVNNFPVNNFPVNNFPVNNFPVNNFPVNNFPVNNLPVVPPTVPGGAPVSAPYLLGFQGMDVGWGVRIVSVNKSGMAVTMGLEPGDVIVQVNGQQVQSLADYHAVMAASGGVVQLIVRDVRSGGIYQMPVVTLAPAGGMAGAVAGL